MEVETVADWLHMIHLERYLTSFNQANYNSLDKCSTLTEKDLHNIGVVASGHVTRILNHLPILTDDVMYVNLEELQETNATDSDKVYVNCSISEAGASAACEDIYDVPMPLKNPVNSNRMSSKISQLFGDDDSSVTPPALPPKRRSVSQEDDETKFGIQRITSQKPVPLPRKKRVSDMSMNVGRSETPSPKPKPRPRVAARNPTMKLTGATLTESSDDGLYNRNRSRETTELEHEESTDESDMYDMSEFQQNICNELREMNSQNTDLPDQPEHDVSGTSDDVISTRRSPTDIENRNREGSANSRASVTSTSTEMSVKDLQINKPLRGSSYVPSSLLKAENYRESVENPYSEMWMMASNKPQETNTKSLYDNNANLTEDVRLSLPSWNAHAERGSLNFTDDRGSVYFDEPPPSFAPPPLPVQIKPAPAVPPRKAVNNNSASDSKSNSQPSMNSSVNSFADVAKEHDLSSGFDAALRFHIGEDPVPVSPVLTRGLSLFDDDDDKAFENQLFKQSVTQEASPAGNEAFTRPSSNKVNSTGALSRPTSDILASFDPLREPPQYDSCEYAVVEKDPQTKPNPTPPHQDKPVKKLDLPRVLPTIPVDSQKPTTKVLQKLSSSESCEYAIINDQQQYDAVYNDQVETTKESRQAAKLTDLDLSEYSETFYVDTAFSETVAPPSEVIYNEADDPWRPKRKPTLGPPPPPRGPNPFFNLTPKESGKYPSNPDLEESFSSHDYAASEGSLSDGGDFIEDGDYEVQPKCLFSDAAIPIVPATPTRSNEKSGFLFKLTSIGLHVASAPSPRRWKKIWVVFDGTEMKYYSDNKKMVSKRIIHVAHMINVDNTVKNGDTHSFQFNLKTTDRIYSFATDELDSMQIWSSCLMQGILMYKPPPKGFPEGGDMENPDKSGFLKIDGLKGKRYVVIKGDKLCYYNNVQDFAVASPICRLEMKLASAKDIGRLRLQLSFPHTRFIIQMSSQGELVDWIDSMRESIAEGLADDSMLEKIYENPENRTCADCKAPDPHWASVNLVVVICSKCAGIHRMLSLPLSKVRSLRMDTKVWTPEVLQLFKSIGNDESNRFWEWDVPNGHKISPDQDMAERKNYIISKYKERKYCQFHPLFREQQALNEALCKSVTFPNVFETMQLLYSGADILCTTNKFGVAGETPLQLAKKSGQTLQMEFLTQNGAEGSGQLPVPSSLQHVAVPAIAMVTHTGYLYKTGPNQKDFHRRWCVLEHGIFSYFENESTPVPKDCIENKEMETVTSKCNERYEHAFELSTTKSGGRVYLFAADLLKDKTKWMNKIAKCFGPEAAMSSISDFDRAGYIFLRESATMAWSKTWIQIFEKQLSIFMEEKMEFEEIDLRKVTSIKALRSGCSKVHEEGQMFVVDLPGGRALYMQADMKKDTEDWLTLFNKAFLDTEGGDLKDNQLTKEDIPVIVEKCINFISTHGMQYEGIYRKNGQHSKITQLLTDFRKDARSVHLKLDDQDVSDVANALKRYFRSLDDPLLTKKLYARFISTVAISDHNSKLEWYKYLLREMPNVNYCTFKKMVRHLVSIKEHEAENKMGTTNLASIFGPVFMTTDRDSSGGFSNAEQEIAVLVDILSYHQWLFEVTEAEIQKEKKIQDALVKFAEISSKPNNALQAGDMLIGVYINNSRGECISNKIPATMNAQELLAFVIKKGGLPQSNLGLFEIICNGDLERPIHYLERVLDIVLKWSSWDTEFCKNNYLCVKENRVYDQISYVIEPSLSLFSELKYSEKRGWKKLCFEFSRAQLSYQKDSRALSPVQAWNVEDLVIYMGCERKRAAPTQWVFTFVTRDETNKITRSKDTPFFGRSICCNNEEELYRWVAGMMHAQRPEGLLPRDENSQPGMRIPPLELRPPPPSVNHTPHKPKMSIKRFFRH